jgi:glycosyltransferase involved in cell wall biosynthesis
MIGSIEPTTDALNLSSIEPVGGEGEEPIRVCFMIDRLAAAGTESQLLALIRHLDRGRVRPFLCLLDGEDEVSGSLVPEDCPVLRLGVRSLASQQGFAAAWRLATFFRRERIEVLQVYFPDSTYLGILAAHLGRVPRIVRTRKNLGYWLTPWHRCLGRLCNLVTNATVANCEACRDAVMRDEGAPAGSVIVLPNGVDFARFAGVPDLACRRGPRCVGSLANLRPVKDLDLLVHAAADVTRAHPDVTFRVAGEGEQRPALEEQVHRLGLAGRFFLPGMVADTPGFLASLDVAVLCSRSEGMSNALLEYMAAGRAIVATAVGANGELIEDGVQGLLVQAGDADGLAAAIRRLLDDPALAARLGAAARRKAGRYHSHSGRARSFEAFYRALLGRE